MITSKTAPTSNTPEDARFLPAFTADFQLAKTDERSESRQNCLYKLECKSYHLEKDTFETSHAVARNYSKCGLYFETNHPFETGSPLHILLKNPGTDPFDSELAKGIHAQVAWCKAINKGLQPCYGIGLRFFERFRS